MRIIRKLVGSLSGYNLFIGWHIKNNWITCRESSLLISNTGRRAIWVVVTGGCALQLPN